MTYQIHRPDMTDAQALDDRDAVDPDPEGQVDVEFSELCCDTL
jgi:hypothetical protein